VQQPETRFALSGDAHIAYQVVGSGPLDVVYVPGWVSNVALNWQEPSYARFLERLASFARLILFDKRGTGLSDRVPEREMPTLEQRMDDVRAVLDAVGSERAALLGVSEGGSMSALFAATYPDRTVALVMYGSYARRQRDVDYPWGQSEDDLEASLREIEQGWGGPVGRAVRAPSAADDPRFMDFWASYLVQSASPQAALTLARMNAEIDIRSVVPSIRVPTLILHRTGDRVVRSEEATYLRERFHGATLVLLDGEDHLPWVGDQDAVLDEIQGFLTGIRRGPNPDRVLATVVFTDIVGSTTKAADIGDARWNELLRAHDHLIRTELSRFRGVEIKTTGDGFLASFDGPARAVSCAQAIAGAVRTLGIEVRAGCHTGEVELLPGDLGGIAVHIGARICSLAGAGEVWVSRTVKDLVAGSGLTFEDRGLHELKGVPDRWHLYAVSPDGEGSTKRTSG
jgi:pimeloyl-ACP methyl ester carboxylesterase